MISPTGLGIRVDSEGDGHYGTSRGSKKHNGIDYICKKGQEIVAPFDLTILRVAKPKRNSPLSGIKWRAGDSTGFIFYFKPNTNLFGEPIKQGTVIGIAQSVSEYYNLPNMMNHVHLQINK